MKMSIQGLLERSCLNAIVSIRPFSNVSTHTTGLWEGYAYSIFDRNNIEILLFPMFTSKTHLPTGTPSRPKTFGMACLFLFLFPPRIRFFSYFFFFEKQKSWKFEQQQFSRRQGRGEILLKGRTEWWWWRPSDTHTRDGGVLDTLCSSLQTSCPARNAVLLLFEIFDCDPTTRNWPPPLVHHFFFHKMLLHFELNFRCKVACLVFNTVIPLCVNDDFTKEKTDCTFLFDVFIVRWPIRTSLWASTTINESNKGPSRIGGTARVRSGHPQFGGMNF